MNRYLLFLVVLFVLFAVLLAIVLFHIIMAMDSPGWSTAVGTISKADLACRGGNWKFFHPSVEYQYQVATKAKTSRRLAFYLVGFRNETRASQEIQGLKAGVAITVYYHPKFHSLAVLKPGPKQLGGWLALAIFSALVGLICGALITRHLCA